MKIRMLLIFSVLSITTLAGCSKAPSEGEPSPPKATHPVALQQEWFPYSGFSGEISGAKRFAENSGIELKVLPGSEQIDPIKLVLAGTTPFGVVGGDLLVSAVAKGAPLVAIGVINQRTPTVFLVRSESSIRDVRDFPGHLIGVLPGTNTERVYELMVKRRGIDRKTIKEIQIPFDLQTFVLKQYDVRPAFVYDEPVSLEQQDIAYRIIDPTDSGVVFTGTVYFTTRKTLEDQRDLVVKLLKTLVQGWKFAVENPEAAIGDLHAAFPSVDSKRELRALQLGRDYFRGPDGNPLLCDRAVWSDMIRGLEEIKEIPVGSVAVEAVWDSSALQQAYKELTKEKSP
jgi:NitT/TauT family transport system substrate-binding protein